MLLGEVWKEDLLCAQVSQRLKYSANCNLIPGSVSLVPRPHPLTRRNGLVNQVEFLGLAHAFATM